MIHIYFDIDGTLLPSGEIDINPLVLDSINQIDPKKAKIFIATGRCYNQALKYINQINADAYITSNGQEVAYDGEIIYQSFFSKNQINLVHELACESNVVIGYEDRNSLKLPDSTDGKYVAGIMEGYGFVNIDFNDEIPELAYQYWYFGEPDDIVKISDLVPNSLSIYKWNESCIELVPKGQNKFNGIEKMLKNVSYEVKTACFGDGENDVDMLKNCDIAFVMDNARDSVKAHATHVVGPCTEDGILEGLKILGVLK